MSYSIYNIIKKKNVNVIEDIIKSRKEKSCVIYLNPFTYIKFRKDFPEIRDIDGIRFDGIFFRSVLSIFMPKMTFVRQSFDMTSLAPKVFNHADENNLSIFLAGGNYEEIEAFKSKIKNIYPGLNFIESCDGYVSEEEIIQKAISSKADIYLLGLGNVKQERVALALSGIVKKGLIFTCGAFISQTVSTKGLTYYPEFVNKFEIRWLYRILKEKHVLPRVVKYYPIFLFYFIYDAMVSRFVKN